MTRLHRIAIVVLVAALVTAGSSAAFAGGEGEQAGASPWLALVNRYRSLAGLPPVTPNAVWGRGDRLHSRYVVKNDQITHDESPSNPWYTDAGAAAGQSGNVMGSSFLDTKDTDAINAWMQGPFHALGILDPRLTRVGYGRYREADGGIQFAATLDVIRGLDFSLQPAYPVMYPSAGPMPLKAFSGGEYPDPLSSCPGYATPSGPPLILQLGDGSLTPHVRLFGVRHAGAKVAACEFDETNYSNPDPGAQSLARSILDTRDAVVIIPKAPLAPGQRYTVNVKANGRLYSWSFRVAANAR